MTSRVLMLMRHASLTAELAASSAPSTSRVRRELETGVGGIIAHALDRGDALAWRANVRAALPGVEVEIVEGTDADLADLRRGRLRETRLDGDDCTTLPNARRLRALERARRVN